MKIMWHGTASLSIDNVLWVDPFIPNKKSKVRIQTEIYTQYDHVFITHAHIDHISSIPRIFKNKKVNIYGTEAVNIALQKLHFNNYNFIQVHPGDCIYLKGYKIKVYRSKHTQFDKELIKKTLVNPRMMKDLLTFIQMYTVHIRCKERNEIIAYSIEKNQQSIFILGSMNIDKNTRYPQNMDMLVMPYQGTSYLDDMADTLVHVFMPKRIFLDHFDDTFPPISNTVDTTCAEIKYDAIKPEYQIPYEII